MENPTTPSLIAPCGINCGLCLGFVRRKVPCQGCRGEDIYKSKSCATCKIKNCAKLAVLGAAYCYECDEFPCALVAHLDKRYRTKYGAHPIENLLFIQEHGLDAFIQNEEPRWACPQCGTRLCMHKAECLACGYIWR